MDEQQVHHSTASCRLDCRRNAVVLRDADALARLSRLAAAAAASSSTGADTLSNARVCWLVIGRLPCCRNFHYCIASIPVIGLIACVGQYFKILRRVFRIRPLRRFAAANLLFRISVCGAGIIVCPRRC